ncbi:preprotein translocase subunit SecA [Candidatus Riesia pediculicola]|uniref:Protein translocase subunit SecA n=1 Tax=Riesia pediculicola (strain USDA) TaxID=515618 RepID=D4G892_RIEPU|nr:preprotein translocase, SecA subunit [Candidatus Riesia pediculicola USDA]ARC53788.1 preprotein translocase subunit SecA [Candidatus Riesia pediculicola]QOJ86424.1 preprotein translocase subunit SecA [Candidatus Riesia pediculicola]
MLTKLLTKIFGSRNERVLRRFKKYVDMINNLEDRFEDLSDSELSRKTDEFKIRLSNGEKLNDLIPEAFATVREASKRVLNIRHFDVQLLGGLVLNERCVAEMKTGEGKTLTSTLPAYLNALSCKGVHIVTVNEYLAKRDAENNRPLFEFLKISVGLNLSGMSFDKKKEAYSKDITYATNNEYGFDYLKDNMVFDKKEQVQRNLHYALIDEVDSILIDEARTPLIISGESETNVDLYRKINTLIPFFKKQDREDSENYLGNGHFSIDEKYKQITLTERGLKLLETLLIKIKLICFGESLYSTKNIIFLHRVISALRAHTLFRKDVDYIVKNGKVIIIDEHTGRMMEGRNWSDGLHQAIEAKEGVRIQDESQTLASITFQNYFRLYEKLAGMTGTADTEAHEFKTIYQLDTIVIPTNQPMIRNDLSDLIYITEKEKILAIIDEIRRCFYKGQPVLVGTISIEKSEKISKILHRSNIPHQILNAKFHDLEAEIIANAGKIGSVTIATNMAGRGTDIVLGGNWKLEIEKFKSLQLKKFDLIKVRWKKQNNQVKAMGGLHIIGTERHESRRIDNQLRGRSGRQGDPGSSRFYLSMEDSLMRIFVSKKIMNVMKKLKVDFGKAIEHPWITKAIENAQKKVEGRNFEVRKQLLEYDDVINDQRCAIYLQRNRLLISKDIKKIISNMREEIVCHLIDKYFSYRDKMEDEVKTNAFLSKLKRKLGLNLSKKEWMHHFSGMKKNEVKIKIIKRIEDLYKKNEEKIGNSFVRNFEKNVMIRVIDNFWRNHLSIMDYLRQGIHLRGYIQKDPKTEYKRESFILFLNMLKSIKHETIRVLSSINTKSVIKCQDLSKKDI